MASCRYRKRTGFWPFRTGASWAWCCFRAASGRWHTSGIGEPTSDEHMASACSVATICEPAKSVVRNAESPFLLSRSFLPESTPAGRVENALGGGRLGQGRGPPIANTTSVPAGDHNGEMGSLRILKGRCRLAPRPPDLPVKNRQQGQHRRWDHHSRNQHDQHSLPPPGAHRLPEQGDQRHNREQA